MSRISDIFSVTKIVTDEIVLAKLNATALKIHQDKV